MRVRPSLDQYFLNIARVVSSRATCLRHKVGAVITKDKYILTTGYNGAPTGTTHCLDIGCIRIQEGIPSGTQHETCRAVHAEQNAIIQAAVRGIRIEGGTLYCTHQPCVLCAKSIINAKLERVVFEQEYPDTKSIEFLLEAGITVSKAGVEKEVNNHLLITGYNLNFIDPKFEE
jgi:dCMP deaminase